MVKTKNTVGQFGTRYGPRNRNKFTTVIDQYRKKLKSPITGKPKKAKRISAGIFIDKQTGVKFTARAYTTTLTDTSKEEEQ